MRREPDFAASGYEVNRRIVVFNLMLADLDDPAPRPKINHDLGIRPARHQQRK